MSSPSPAPSEAETTEGPLVGRFASLRHRDFVLYLSATFFLTVGVGFQGTALGAQIFALTESERALGLVNLFEAIPAIFVALFAGHLADRGDRKKIILVSALALTASALVLAWLADPAAGPSITGSIYLVVAFTGLSQGLLGPSRSALGAELVPRSLLADAINLRTSAWQIGMCLGPPIGGAVYAAGGARTAYLVDAGLIFAAFLALAAIRKRPVRPPKEGESVLHSLQVGVRFVFSRKEILGALSLDLFAVLFGGAIALLPKFAVHILGVGPEGLGVLRAAPSVGAVFAAVLLTALPPIRRAGPTMLISVALFGVAWICFGLSTSFVLSLVLLALTGAFDYVSVVVRHTLVQTRTPVEMLGRVSAVNAIFIGSSNEIGGFESGELAHWMGTVPSVVFGGCMTLVVVAIVAWRCPTLRRLGSLR